MTNRLQKGDDGIGVKCKIVVYISKGVIKGKKSVFSKVRKRFFVFIHFYFPNRGKFFTEW